MNRNLTTSATFDVGFKYYLSYSSSRSFATAKREHIDLLTLWLLDNIKYIRAVKTVLK